MAAITIQQFRTVLEVLTSSGDSKIKNIRTGKEETKLFVIHRRFNKIPKSSKDQLLELRREFSRVMINI